MQSPGHQKWPEHKVKESHIDKRIEVEVDGQVVADSHSVIRVDEDEYPARYYFPRGDVRMDLLERSTTTTECPFKGMASYYSVSAGGKRLDDAVWTYEDPFDEHRELKDRVAFYDDKYKNIRVHAMPGR
jgi:uncharacterized protein (DUF427 family)